MDPVEPVTYVASTTVSTTESFIPAVGFDVFEVLGGLFNGGLGFDGGGILGFLNSLWTTLAVLAYIASFIMLVLYIFASIRRNLYLGLMSQELRDAERAWEERELGLKKGGRLNDVLVHSVSDNPSDWKLAIIEADIILDQTLKDKGYPGESLGERLRNITPVQMDTINDAWEAHKVRNKIAHEGADFVLTQRIVQETITRYQKVFNELGVS